MQGKVRQTLLRPELLLPMNQTIQHSSNCSFPVNPLLMICQGVAASWFNCVGGESPDDGEAALYCILCGQI